MNLSRLSAIARKEWREIVRDRIFVLLAFLLPSLLMLVFGYGLTQDIEHMPLVVVDGDRSAASREYAQRFVTSRHFAFEGYASSVAQAGRLMAAGQARVVIVIDAGFGADLAAGRTAAVQTLIDATFLNSARVVKGYIDAMNGEAGAALLVARVSRQLGVPPGRAETMLRPVRAETRFVYNQRLETVWAVAPSLIMNIMMWTSPLLVALSVVREKESGSIYNIYASQTTRVEFLLGKLLPCAAVSFFNGVALWLLATWYFGAPFRGSVLAFLGATLAFVLATSAIGLLVSLWVETQQAALMIVVVLGAVIAMHFSGMFEPVSSMRPLNRAIAHVFPGMYFNDVAQRTFLKGAGPADVWRDVLTTALFAAAAFALSCGSFRKRVAA